MAEKDDDLTWSMPPPAPKPATEPTGPSAEAAKAPEAALPDVSPPPGKRVADTLRKVAAEKRVTAPLAPRQRVPTMKGIPDVPVASKPKDEETTGKTNKLWAPSGLGGSRPRAPSKTLIGVAPPAPRVPKDLEHLTPPKPAIKVPFEPKTDKTPKPKPAVVVSHKTQPEMKAPSLPRAPMVSLPPDPAVLLVADGYPDAARLEEELGGLSLYVELATLDDLYRVTVTTAPDLVVLAGPAAEDGGRRARSQLETSELTAAVPLVIIEARPKLDSRLRASRLGARLVEDGKPDEIAKEISRIARGTAVASPESSSVESAGTASLNELLALLSDELRTGILSVKPESAPGRDAPLRLVLGEGVPLARAIDEFVKQLKQHVIAAEPIHYEVHERPAGSVYVLGKDSVPATSAATIKGLRIVIADDDAARSDAVAQELRQRGAEVVVSGLNPDGHRFDRLRRLDASILMIGEADLRGRAFDLVKRLHRDTRARWSSWLVVRWDELWPEAVTLPEIERVIGACAALGESEKTLAERARGPSTFDTRIEVVGPARMLRAISECVEPRRVIVHNPRLDATIDLAGAALLGASGTLTQTGRRIGGIEALSALMVVTSGSVRVEYTSSPLENVGLGVISALLDADRGEAPLEPSIRPPPGLDAIGAALAEREPARRLELGSGPEWERISAPDPEPEPVSVEAAVAPHTPIAIPEPPPLSAPAPERLALPEIEPVRLGAPFTAPAANKQRLMIVAGVVIGALLFLILAISVYSRSKTDAPPTAASERTTPPVASSASIEDSLVARARRGEDDAVAALEKRPNQLSIDESLALAQGKIEHQRREMIGFIRGLEQKPERLSADNKRKLRDWTRDGQFAPDALRAVALLPGPRGPDLLYWLWIGTAEKNSTAQIAGQLLQSEEVRKKASPALLVALDLRRTEVCEELSLLLPVAKEKGDRRALRPLARLIKKTGCGTGKTGDCYPCLRAGKDLNEALTAVKTRPEPAL